jgi:hypothetical protein
MGLSTTRNKPLIGSRAWLGLFATILFAVIALNIVVDRLKSHNPFDQLSPQANVSASVATHEGVRSASSDRVGQLVGLLRRLEYSRLRGRGEWFEFATIGVEIDGRGAWCIRLHTRESYRGHVVAQIESGSVATLIGGRFDGTANRTFGRFSERSMG